MGKGTKKEEQGGSGSVGTIKIRKTCDMFYTYDDFMDDQERGCATCGQKESLHKK